MHKDDIILIEKQLESNRFGIMKLSSQLGCTLRMLVEVDRIADQSSLVCLTSDASQKLKNNKAYSASLRLVNKEDETYTIINGICRVHFNNDSQAELSFEMRNQKSFRKKQVSQFTSFLEKITPRRASRVLPGGTYYSNPRVA